MATNHDAAHANGRDPPAAEQAARAMATRSLVHLRGHVGRTAGGWARSFSLVALSLTGETSGGAAMIWL